ncbi:hypothetical protein BDV29DRAFT_122910 [Aspergillus leporis]|uniref:Uncharacterized protein n=1 Tax=Aspergillus leporis TaxID=41062 RepID=A0A5N5X3C2_9EURO|nr:hypothetical protein BDV29DRAFT_122910 [Aspergillus leporis]
MQFSWFALMVVTVLSAGVVARGGSKDTSSTTTATTSETSKPSKTSEKPSSKPTKNAAAGSAQNNPFAFLREL